MVFANDTTFTTSGIDLSLFDPMVLRDQVAFESAICSFEQKLFDPGVDKVKLVDDLMSVRHLFQLVFSAVGEPSAEYIQECVFQSYAMTAYEFSGSQVQRLLEDLAHFAVAFFLVPSAVEFFRSVQSGAQALTSISSAFNNTMENDAEQPSSPVSLSSPMRRRRNFSHVSQREQKKARTKTSIAIDPKPFKDLSVDVPTSKDEADNLAQKILTTQRDLLEQYLSSLRNPELFNVIKSAYIPAALLEPEPHSETPLGNEPGTTDELYNTPMTPSAFPMVQPLRAALHFDSPEGFGEWRVMIPSSAHRDLRDAKRRNPKLFKIIVKKIMELSNGHFSDDNQKKLNNTSVGVPIFEAKMTSDTRLVYQIDCNQDFETGVERQVIQVYGVYTHAQLERFDWDNLGSKLARRGSTYRERCVFRSEPRQPGKNVIAPGSFPPQAESLTHALKLSIPTRRINDHNEERQKNTMLEKFAMFSKDFLSGIITDDDGAYVFQMSPTEQEIVKYVGSSYVLGRSGTGKTTTMLYKILGIERAWQELLQQDRELEGSSGKPRQMFVTQSKMLAKNVEGYYDKLVASHGMGRRSNQQHHDLLINLDEETEWRKDLPHRFGLLKDEHFPLFLTFDELCKMLENESDHASKLQSSSNTLSDSDSSQQDSFVSWRRFRSVYWDHFPQNLTKLFEPYLVFGEFMGIIKGSEMTLTSNTGYLDSATYLGLSHRAADTFASSREEIYHLFEVYLRLKKEYGDNDAADRTQKLLRLMTELGIPGQAIDYIYVDETQDNLLIDTLVLRSLCRNSMGLFWAGDTAQTISAGSAFRFKDLKAFLWRIENKLYKSSSLKTTKAPVHPKEFQLAINYRSHAGIIDCAQTVIHILTKFWPNAIDILKEEKGDNDGVKPIMFTGWSEHTLPFEQHLFGDRHHQIEFGANQCILVRNEEARVQLRERVGAVGMILTLQESKGLEFNDVLLYNFFNDSGVSLSNWRIVLNIIQDNDAKTTRNLDVCHTVVCRELKFLYVAITRARNNVWIADSSNKGDHMRDVWLSRDQIEICTPNDPIPKLAVSSAQAEWAERGRSFLQQEASLLPPSSDVHDATFVQAAEVFTQCASSTSVTEEAQAYYRLAGRCFTEIGNYQRAGDSFLAAHEYTGSAQAYRKADNFDTAVQVVQEHETDVDPDVAYEIIDVAKLHYFKEHDVEKAVELFDSLEEAVEYTEDFGFDEAQADILVGHMNQPTDAAELHFREGRIFTALDILLESPHDASIFSLCLRYIRAGLWRLISFGVQPSKVIDEAARYFSYTRKVSECYSLTDYDNMQIVMFSAILRDDHPTLHRLAAGFLLDHHDKAASGLCLDYVFAHSVEVLTAASTLEPMSSILRSFLEYVNILSFVAYDTDACTKDWVQQLFGFKTCGEKKTITMYQRTLVYSQVEGLSSSELANESTIPMQDFIPILQRVARERLKTRVQQENELCTLSPVIFPCIVFAIYGECSRTSCALGHTRSQQVFSAPAFNLRLRTVIQQILIYRTAEFLMEYNHQMRQRRFWLKSLYELLNPPHPTLGSLANVDWSTIPEFDKGVLTINYWVQDRLFSLNPFTLVEMSRWLFLSSVLQMSSLGFLLNFRQTQRYLHRVPFVYKRPPFNFFSGHHSIIHSVLRSLDGSGNNPFNDGFVFLRHAIVTKLHLDISILCDLLDHLCGLLIVTFHKSFHNTILPRSWMLKLIGMNPIANSNLHLSLSSANDFVGVIHELLADIFSKDHYDRLFFANRKWYYSPSWDVIQIFLSRMYEVFFQRFSTILLLEDVNKALNNSIGMLKQVAKLQADLDPGSDFHHLQDARQFQQKMEAIKKLVFMLPAMNRSEWEFDFNMAMRAVKREGDTLVISKKRLKPCLNTEDLDIAYY